MRYEIVESVAISAAMAVSAAACAMAGAKGTWDSNLLLAAMIQIAHYAIWRAQITALGHADQVALSAVISLCGIASGAAFGSAETGVLVCAMILFAMLATCNQRVRLLWWLIDYAAAYNESRARSEIKKKAAAAAAATDQDAPPIPLAAPRSSDATVEFVNAANSSARLMSFFWREAAHDLETLREIAPVFGCGDMFVVSGYVTHTQRGIRIKKRFTLMMNLETGQSLFLHTGEADGGKPCEHKTGALSLPPEYMFAPIIGRKRVLACDEKALHD